MTYYDILGVPPNATQEEITAAYRAMVKAFHPDVYIGKKEFAEEKTRQLVEAYNILKDPEERLRYDNFLAYQSGQQSAEPPDELEKEPSEPSQKNPPHQPQAKADFTSPSELSVRWLNFYRNFLLPFSVLKGAIGFIVGIFSISLSDYSGIAVIIVLFAYSIDLSAVIMLLLNCLFLRHLNSRSYYFNQIALAYLCFYNGLSLMSNSFFGTGNTASYICASLFWFAFFAFPNFVYFSKRRILFGLPPSDSSLMKDTFRPALFGLLAIAFGAVVVLGFVDYPQTLLSSSMIEDSPISSEEAIVLESSSSSEEASSFPTEEDIARENAEKLAQGFAEYMGYDDFNLFILDNPDITDRSVTNLPIEEKMLYVAQLYGFERFEDFAAYVKQEEDKLRDAYYWASYEGKSFHYYTCDYVGRINYKNLIFFESRQEALEAGYEPCRVYDP